MRSGEKSFKEWLLDQPVIYGGPPSGAQDRDDKDFAIEHAGYLADMVERVLTAERSILDAEDWLNLNVCVYEFRKRVARVKTCAG